MKKPLKKSSDFPNSKEEKKTIRPQLAQTAKEAFDHKDWLFELKLDGVRCIAFLDNETRLQARSGQDITAQFPELSELHRLAVKPCILDGEIICATFNQVQHRIHRTKPLDIRVARRLYPARFYAFDLLEANHKAAMNLPQSTRKETLTTVMKESEQGLILPWRDGEGIALFREVQNRRQEGIMAKLKSAPYLEGKRVDWWLKIKNFQEGTFYICGLTEGENDRKATFGSLILGELKDGKWLYVGNVGSGFDQQELKELAAHFNTLRGDCPFEQVDVGRPVKLWTRPVIQCEVKFLERGSDGKLRFPTFRKLID
ncbi:MAG: ATP-dependent DNA ligase [Dehalococcoides mccartyi]|uniref:ATP-dependent DNA ligase n=1 Tax=Dehalococcoides mccartyi TaxID=61435 RepID=UPI0030F80761